MDTIIKDPPPPITKPKKEESEPNCLLCGLKFNYYKGEFHPPLIVTNPTLYRFNQRVNSPYGNNVHRKCAIKKFLSILQKRYFKKTN